MNRWQHVSAAQSLLARETGAVHKDPGGKLTVALAYPNTYHLGMSSLALHLLYHAFNARPHVLCERAFWDPVAASAGRPLISLESQSDLAAFDVLAFTISFEMDYFNVAAILAQAGLPALAEERGGRAKARPRASLAPPGAAPDVGAERWPILIAGGPAVTMNPEPLAPFFDALVIGEVEELVDPLLEILRDAAPFDEGRREAALRALDRLPGVYVPALAAPHPGGRRIQRGWARSASGLEPVSRLYTPDTALAGMRLIEIARGCGRGCRFCLAGYAYRPPREQPADLVLDWARGALQDARSAPGRPAGIGLVAAAVSDHSQIDLIAGELHAMGTQLHVSSMRADPPSVPLLKALAAGGAQTLTIAPEAGSERLRRVINKPQSEDSLLTAAGLAQTLGFSLLKLYFMVGHPAETDDDIQGIVDLTARLQKVFKRRVAINATPFVPKAQTPFERVAMTPARILGSRQNRLARALARNKVAVKADSPGWAEVQAVLSRGDRRLAPVLAALAPTVLNGGLTVRAFHEALAAEGLQAGQFLNERPPDAFLPWRIVEGGVSETFLSREYGLALAGRAGHSCWPRVMDPAGLAENEAGQGRGMAEPATSAARRPASGQPPAETADDRTAAQAGRGCRACAVCEGWA